MITTLPTIKVLVKRKEENGKNIEFRYQLKKQYEDTSSTIVFSQTFYPISLKNIIAAIKQGEKFYTKDSNGMDSLAVVEGGDQIEEYISSLSNDGKTDNINNLPTYS